MKASDLVSNLQDFIKAYGDVEIKIPMAPEQNLESLNMQTMEVEGVIHHRGESSKPTEIIICDISNLRNYGRILNGKN